jgi:T5SS/PEP-CTERM-associated repeat protein
MRQQTNIMAVVLIIILAFGGPTTAADTYWQVDTGNWSTGSNWTGGEPYSSTEAYINNGGTALITQSGETCDRLWLGRDSDANGTVKMSFGDLTVVGREHVGFNGEARFVQSGGTHSVGLGDDPNFAGLYIGHQNDANGTYILADGQLQAENEFVGYNGRGNFLHIDGDNLIQRDLYLGYNPGSYGQYVEFAVTSNLMGGFAVKCTTIGHYGTGVFKHYNGTHTVRGNLKVGAESGSDGTYYLHDGQLSADSEYIGYAGTGTFTQSGGTHEVNSTEPNYGNLYIGYTPDGNGTYELRGGDLFAENEYIGFDGAGSGHFFHTGGNNMIKNDLYLGFNPGSHGLYIYDAAVTSNLMGGFAVKCETIGYWGTGHFKHYGGTHIVRGNLVLGRQAGSIGIYEISNDILSVEGDLQIGRSGTGTLEITGGTIDVFSDTNDGTIKISDANCQSGRLNLFGGTITANSLSIYPANGTMDIQGEGTLVVDGNSVELIDQYMSTGLITAYNGNRAVIVDYNGTNPGKTTVTAANCPSGDLSEDCTVNFEDVAVLGEDWLKTGAPP